MGSVLHITNGDKKFFPEYITFLERHFELSEHHFLLLDQGQPLGQIKAPHTKVQVKSLAAMLRATGLIKRYDKVFIHGLFEFNLILAKDRNFKGTYPMNRRMCALPLFG